VVASVTLGQDIDLNEIVATIPDIEYHPEQFPGLVYRLKKPKTATLIFRTGKMVCTGGKSVKDAKRAVHKIVKNLNEAGIKITGKPEITIQNIVASGDIGMHIDLERAIATLENCMYEPEQFPGLIYRLRDPKTVVLVFGSGKIVITGAKLEEHVPEVAIKVRDRLLELDLVRMDDMP
jgi:transcription initiation factor TFIID TATA-box-binding protein